MRELNLQKLKTEYRSDQDILYFLEAGSEIIALNQYLGKKITLEHTGQINCVNCERVTKKSFAQGHCYPCFKKLASCDMCLMKPETCHYDQGTCREPQWGEENCMIPHTVYLANSSGLKVGITRGETPVNRWMDQGAIGGIPLATVEKRLDAGHLEVALKAHVADKTNWRAMLKGDVETIDLEAARERLKEHIPVNVPCKISDTPALEIKYPVLQHPEKVKSFNFDKDPTVSGVLHGIKGQYLIFDTGVINIRKFSGYQVRFS